MTGMKEGAGEDPFAEDSANGEDGHSKSETTNETSQAQENQSIEDDAIATTKTSASNTEVTIPYKYRRESVQEGRDRVPLFLHPETKSGERKAMRELEERFDDNISLTDLREALVKAGLENLDTTQSHLENWGYGLDFD